MKFLKLPWELLLRIVVAIATTLYETFKSNPKSDQK